jgi:MYXO-CTERM domain-containing protein
MKRSLSLLLAAVAALVARPAGAQHVAAFKSPGPGMHFTEGLPVVVFLDLFDSPGSGFGSIDSAGVGWPQAQLQIDGVTWPDNVSGLTTIQGGTTLDMNGNPGPIDFYRIEAASVPAGTHQLVGKGLFRDGTNLLTSSIAITVDPWPTDKTQMNLTGNVTMSNVNWTNVAIKGNGGSITLSGNVTIKNSLITGVSQIMTASGGSVGTVDIEDTIFEDSGTLTLAITGTATIKNNEFRANNRLTFVSNDPNTPTIIEISGRNTSTKTFAGNRIGAGRVDFGNASNWLIGGDTDDASNILIGPRCTLNVVNSSQMTLRGNYDHHNYRGGWSQGFNFYYYGSTDGILSEHNLVRGGSWPIQNVAGEFRYNVVFGFGHDWVRTAANGTAIHHNLFTPEGAGDLGEGMVFYSGETGLQIYNNTFDAGALTADFAQPFIRLTGSTQATSARNNLFTFSRDMSNGNPGSASVASQDTAAYASVDYNAFYNPDNAKKDNYSITNSSGAAEGSTGFGGHDVSGTGALGVMDAQLASSPYAGARVLPFEMLVDESAVWNKTQRMSTILAAFRVPYTPKAGSPIIDAGDPADNDSQGRRADIGAIDVAGHDQDKLGKFGTTPSETVPPTVSLTSPTAGATVSGIINLAATAMDNPGGSGVVLVQFQVDGTTVGQTAASPYMVSFNTGSLTNGDHAFAAKAWDAAGNYAVSASVTAHVVVVANPDGGITPPDGGGSPTGTGGTHGGGGGGGSGGTTAPPVSGGCHCTVPDAQAGRGPALLLLALVAAPLAIRRRRPRSRR